jgi:diadenosine tetraphosphatase ApaH/serine/threonine PP2A family protein phosphatase
VREVLDTYSRRTRARGYVLDEQGRLRQHMASFVDGRQVHDRERLSDAVGDGAVDSWQTISMNLPPVFAVRFDKLA